MVLNYWQIIGLIFFGFFIVLEAIIFLSFTQFVNEQKQESKNKINQEKNGSDDL